FGSDGLGCVESIRAGKLENRQSHCRLVVQVTAHVVVLGAEVHAVFVANDVSQIGYPAIFTDLGDDAFKLSRLYEPALRVNRKLIILPNGNRLLTELTGGNLNVLFADGFDHIAGG